MPDRPPASARPPGPQPGGRAQTCPAPGAGRLRPSDAPQRDRSRPVLERACALAGLPAAGAVPLRFGLNAVWRLDRVPVVVRIARDASRMTTARRELRAARWLADAGVPAIRPASGAPSQPLLADGHPVTFWELAEGPGPPPAPADLARLLTALHAAPGEPPGDIPPFDPLAPARRRAAAAAWLGDTDRAFLLRACDQAGKDLAALGYELPAGIIHGDALTGNTVSSARGPLLIDFETVCRGPREWDLVPTAIGADRFGIPASAYREFAGIYGTDIREHPGYPVLRRARELGQATWLALAAGTSTARRAEALLRIRSLREGDLSTRWTAF